MANSGDGSMGAGAPRGSVKGTVLHSRLNLVRARGGDVAVDKLLSRLRPEDRKQLTGIVLAVAWYPFDLADRLDHAIAEWLGGGDGAYRLLGEISAADNLAAAHRNFIDAGDPHGLLRHAAEIYRLYYDTGRRSYERTGDRSAVIRTFESLSFSRTDCLTIAGWHEKAIALCGGGRPTVEEPRCRTAGDTHCEYRCRWD